MHASHIANSPHSSQFLLVAGNHHDIRPHQTCTSTAICQERGEDWERFRLRVSTGSSANSSPGFRAGHRFLSPVNFRADLPLCLRLPLRRLGPTSIIGHPPRFLRLHACSAVPLTTACMPLTSSLAYFHAKVHIRLQLTRRPSSSADPVHQPPPSLPIGLTPALMMTAGSV